MAVIPAADRAMKQTPLMIVTYGESARFRSGDLPEAGVFAIKSLSPRGGRSEPKYRSAADP